MDDVVYERTNERQKEEKKHCYSMKVDTHERTNDDDGKKSISSVERNTRL